MNPKFLILVDAASSLVLKVLALIINKALGLARPRNVDSKKILIVKFLGAGNFVSIANQFSSRNLVLVTVRSNFSALRHFFPHVKIILINDEGFGRMALSILNIIPQLLILKVDSVINLEAESSFAKFISSLPWANTYAGLSNKNKSIYDYLFYDRYLVSPVAMSRERIISILAGADAFKNNVVSSGFALHNLNLLTKVEKSKSIKTVLVSPTCSLTDSNRRLATGLWFPVVNYLLDRNLLVKVAFPSVADPQYAEFKAKYSEIDTVEFCITNYNEFVDNIKLSDLLLTVDSQALHIAQTYSKFVMCFYGPTSPYGVSLSEKTWIYSRGIECSPCTHKYMKIPCGGKVSCMNFDVNELLEGLRELIDSSN